jgi:hypothetical protein
MGYGEAARVLEVERREIDAVKDVGAAVGARVGNRVGLCVGPSVGRPMRAEEGQKVRRNG